MNLTRTIKISNKNHARIKKLAKFHNVNMAEALNTILEIWSIKGDLNSNKRLFQSKKKK